VSDFKEMESPIEWAKSQCNRYVNGVCQTRGCLRRGGWKPGEPLTSYDMATCVPHETVKQLAELESTQAKLTDALSKDKKSN
jgi:hypothetical protein